MTYRNKYANTSGKEVAVWAKRIDRMIRKLKAHNVVVNIIRRKRTNNHVIHIMHYDLSTMQRQPYFSEEGKRYRVRESEGFLEFPVEYFNPDKTTGVYGAVWSLAITLPESGAVTVAYATTTTGSCSAMFKVGSDTKDDYDLFTALHEQQFSSLPLAPQLWETTSQYRVDYKLLRADNVQSLPALIIGAGDDPNKIKSLLADHLNIIIPRSDSIIVVPNIIELPNK